MTGVVSRIDGIALSCRLMLAWGVAFPGVSYAQAHGPSAQFGKRTSSPDTVDAHESAALRPPIVVLGDYGVPEPAHRGKDVRVDDFGAQGNGRNDDTEAIRCAVALARPGDTIVFSSGKTYRKSGIIVVDKPDVAIWGYGATVLAIVTDEQADKPASTGIAFRLAAPGTSIFGLTIVSNLRMRPPGDPTEAAVWLAARNHLVIDNRFEYTGNGVFCHSADDFFVARNVVYRTVADGIHVTNGCHRGLVVGNVVRQTGDDMIAVVSYGIGPPKVTDILIAHNDVADQYWGRGISVVGGADITIANNTVARTPVGAGILINSETYWQTSNVRNVRVANNSISDVQTERPTFQPLPHARQAGHGAIDINGQGSQRVTDVLVADNVIHRAKRDGIFVRGNSCNISLVRNRMESLGGQAVHIASNIDRCRRIWCDDNRVDGNAAISSYCNGAALDIVGATIRRFGDGRR